MAYILLVEDNDALSETIKDVLENNDHRCVIKHNIKFAKEFLKNREVEKQVEESTKYNALADALKGKK